MDKDAFASQLREEGFDEIAESRMDPGKQVGVHNHAYGVKALITQGEITLGVAGTRTTYRAGDVFSLASGCDHDEQCGPEGVSYMVGRRHA